MPFKKVMQGEFPIVLGDSDSSKKMFPPGFSYKLGGIIFTVTKDVTKEQSSPMRELILSDGASEIIGVESIIKDLKEPDCVILEPNERHVKKEAIKKVAKKKVVKKKTKKKIKKKN